jgi:hypothetical protein
MAKHTVNRPIALQFSCFRDLEQIFGPPPILEGEDSEAYFAIGQAIWEARPPEDFIQATRINDIVYLLWEGSRIRRLKIKLIEASKIEGAKKLIRRISGKYHDETFWSDWALGDQETVEYVDQYLAAAGLHRDAILAQTVETIVDTLETLERQSAQFEARRLVTIREFDQYSDAAERRQELADERQKLIADQQPKKSKSKLGKKAEETPLLPLDLEAAE